MSNIKTEMGILRKEQKEMLEVKSNITAMENNFGGLISRLDTAKERILSMKTVQ